MKRLQALILAGTWVVAAGCFIDAGSFAGKGCETNNDCPSPYACVQVRFGGRTCELVHGLGGGTTGTGTGTGGGSGGVGGGSATVNPDYCHDVKKLIDASCLSNCHGLAMDYPGTRKDFRLDYYVPMGADTLPGVRAKAVGASCVPNVSCIKTRVTDDTMPPGAPYSGPRPNQTERALIIKWVNTGAAECLDSGTSSDGGTDGGGKDGGDGGDGG